VTVTLVAPSMTWLLVRISPAGASMTKPVPFAVSCRIPQVGGHVHHAGLDRLVDGLGVQCAVLVSAAARADVPVAAGPGDVRC
jgi:hypothetical protein